MNMNINNIDITVNGNYKTFKDITPEELKTIFIKNPDFCNTIMENEKQMECDSYISEILNSIDKHFIDYDISEYGYSYIKLINTDYFDIPKQLYYVSDGIKETQENYCILPENKTEYINKLASVAYKYYFHTGYNDFISDILYKSINSLLSEIKTELLKIIESYNDIDNLVNCYYDICDLNDDYIIDTEYNVYQIDIKRGV